MALPAAELGGLIKRALHLDGRGAVGHAEVVTFLSQPGSYPHAPDEVRVIETHLSLIFIAGEFVYKLKRPIKLDFLDFRLLEDRRRACESEFQINQQLAPGVYLEIAPVIRERSGELSLVGQGTPVEWLVKMRRLDNSTALDRIVTEGKATPAELDRICDTLGAFYRAQPPVDITADDWVELWREKIRLVERSLTDPLFALAGELVDPPLAALDRFLSQNRDLLDARSNGRRIIDGHGDLKPEHVYLEDRVLLIDRLEFDERLRWCDPFDEIVLLGIECSRLGAPWMAPMLVEKLAARLGEQVPAALLRFYSLYRACMRARLMVEHLRDEAPRTPEKWPRKTRAYLRLAAEILVRDD